MQIAGIQCGICKKNVMMEGDATWCASCRTVLHRLCLERADNICPACKRAYDSPERHFVFSQVCPECMQHNNPPQAHCVACNAGTRWDTQADYDQFVTHMKDTARLRLLRGFAEIGGGTLCLFALIAALAFTRPGFGALCLFLLGFMVLTADGIVSLMRSRRIGRFR